MGLQNYLQDPYRPISVPNGLQQSLLLVSGNGKLQLLELEEMRLNAYESSRLYKEKVKAYHDKKLLKKEFRPGQQVLLFNSRLKFFPGKLKSKWSGPFTIKEVRPYRAVELFDPQSETPDRTWIVNGQRLKLYHGGNIERLTTILQLQDP